MRYAGHVFKLLGSRDVFILSAVDNPVRNGLRKLLGVGLVVGYAVLLASVGIDRHVYLEYVLVSHI